MKAEYLETIGLIERLHRHFLEIVKLELDGLGVHDINNVQGLILYNIGDAEMTVGELTLRLPYAGRFRRSRRRSACPTCARGWMAMKMCGPPARSTVDPACRGRRHAGGSSGPPRAEREQCHYATGIAGHGDTRLRQQSAGPGPRLLRDAGRYNPVRDYLGHGK